MRLTLARLIVTYVQSIEYQRVKDDPYGLVPPALVVNSTGDCDSKGLLAVMLLRLVGIDAALLESNTARHAMVGVDLPMGSDRLWHRGRSYAVVEVTATQLAHRSHAAEVCFPPRLESRAGSIFDSSRWDGL